MMNWVFERGGTVGIVLLVLNETNKESSAGLNVSNINQGDCDNKNNLSTPNGSNFETGASAIIIAAEDGQTPGTLLNEINNESSAGANITNNQQDGGGNGNNPSTLNET